MGLHNVLYNGESKSRAPFGAATALVYTIKAFKQAWYVLFGNSTTIIRNPNYHLVFYEVFHTYFRSSLGQSVFNGVDQQIADHLLYFITITVYVNGIGVLHIKG